MTDFKVGDRVRMVRYGIGEGVVNKVGATCLYCQDDGGFQFHSQIENFELVKPRSEHHTPILIAIAGRKGHGKDTAAKALEGFENVKFAGALKAMVRAFLDYVGFDAETIERCIEGDLKEVPLDCFGGQTTRYVMQTLGTEWGRDTISSTIWVDAFASRARQFDKVVATDMRFPNEVEAVKAMGGVTVRIVNSRLPRPEIDHPSEALIDTLPVDWEIANDWGVEDLHLAITSVAAQASK